MDRADCPPQACSTSLYHPRMSPGVRDVAQIRLDNAMLLFEEFVQATVKHPDAATLRGLAAARRVFEGGGAVQRGAA